MSPTPLPIDLIRWIDEHADELRPPVSNKVVVEDDHAIVMVVRGPNARSDFHIDPRSEVFYQLRGAIRVDLIDGGERTTRIVREGELLLVPGGMPHSPMRPADTWGVVIEQPRGHGEIDQLVWFCDECGAELHRVAFALDDIETQLADAIGRFEADRPLRTCERCGTVAAIPAPFCFTDPPDG